MRPLLSVIWPCILVLQLVDRGVHLVDAVGALLDQVPHGAHVHVDGLLHAGDLVLQRLDLGLQLNDLFVDGECRTCRRQNQHGCEPELCCSEVA